MATLVGKGIPSRVEYFPNDLLAPTESSEICHTLPLFLRMANSSERIEGHSPHLLHAKCEPSRLVQNYR
jgi:hypothetical protein